ncbi:hydroxymyristoyl-ACP dehydratase [Christiangramia sabulilitoris]|uniref:Hydroxymyristoyl-ACP dehydratase n=1 Tax=Christiangramia sabulilitoris TaxID=2583991 RepID=A0A550I617_9FLAO|nr:hydroxymyristoyl-ACP dehydratase [Christiangramia sabulilitoris]TRO66423.1 hydroxymyristoyl-ACP dehydratase [Christiangramia sabulilitoris]
MILEDFYEVTHTSVSGDSAITKLQINKDHEIYKGHFPGRPVTPGVVLMQLFKEEAERIFAKKLQLVRADNVKFTAVFDPTVNRELILESDITEVGEFIKLKGSARNSDGTVLKLNCLYKAG